MKDQIEKIQAYFKAEMERYNNDTPETQELVARNAVMQMAKAVWPNEVELGKFDFLANDKCKFVESDLRVKEDGTRIRGKMHTVPEIGLHAFAGFAVAALRTKTDSRDKMGRDAACKKVERWSGIKTETLKKWTPAVGDVKRAGLDIIDAEGKNRDFNPHLQRASTHHAYRHNKKSCDFRTKEAFWEKGFLTNLEIPELHVNQSSVTISERFHGCRSSGRH